MNGGLSSGLMFNCLMKVYVLLLLSTAMLLFCVLGS